MILFNQALSNNYLPLTTIPIRYDQKNHFQSDSLLQKNYGL
jgi:hypothetical protein